MAGQGDRDREAGDDDEPRVGESTDGPTVDVPSFESSADVLVLGSMTRARDDAVCGAFFGEDPSELDVLLVSLTHSAADRIRLFRDRPGGFPRNLSVVSAADGAASTTEVRAGDDSRSVTVETVSDPGDFPKLGITVTQALNELADDGDVRACFHSLTALLQYGSPQRVFRFVHLLTNRLAPTGAVTHYHMDPEAHDARTIATLRSLFDEVVELDDEAGSDT